MGRDGEIHQDERWTILGLGEIRKGFRVCNGCGLVLQDPAIPPPTMQWFYANLSNYTNPMAGGRPSEVKRRAVEAQLDFLAGRIATGDRVFQVGSSDGYTLSRFADLGCHVQGCDPSANAAGVAQRLWRVETRVTPFERYAFEPDETYEMIVLTHVLEHLYDPVETLERCAEALAEDGRIFIEVPLLAAPERLPPGYFQFEHINYFSEQSLLDTLHIAGLEIEGAVGIDLDSDQYPIQRLVAKSANGAASRQARQEAFRRHAQEIATANRIMLEYTERDTATWHAFEEKIVSAVGESEPAYLWGAGIHTSILLGRTRLAERVKLLGLVDSDSQKWDLCFGSLPVLAPDAMLEKREGTAIVLSTLAGERAIHRYLLEHGVARDEIVCLYGADGECDR